MKRWFIARLGDYENDGGNVPKINLYTQTSRIWTKPGFGWCFGQLAAGSVTEMQADPDIYILPDGAMDMSVSSIPVTVRNTLRTRLESAGFEFGAVKTVWTVRQLLNYLLQQLQPIPSVEAGDIPDVN